MTINFARCHRVTVANRVESSARSCDSSFVSLLSVSLNESRSGSDFVHLAKACSGMDLILTFVLTTIFVGAATYLLISGGSKRAHER